MYQVQARRFFPPYVAAACQHAERQVGAGQVQRGGVDAGGQVVQIDACADGDVECGAILPPFQFAHQAAPHFVDAVAVSEASYPAFAEIVPTGEAVVHVHVFGVVARYAVGIKAQQDAVLFGRKRVLQGGFELLDEFGGRQGASPVEG